MLIIRAIPRYLLVHRAELYNIAGVGCFGERNYEEPISLRFIRVDYTSGINRDGIKGFNDKGAGQAVLIYDCRNSLPSGVGFEIGQKIVFEGHVFTVCKTAVYYGIKRAHHIEVIMEEVGI